MWHNFQTEDEYEDMMLYEQWLQSFQSEPLTEEQWEAVFENEPAPEEIEAMNQNAELLLADIEAENE